MTASAVASVSANIPSSPAMSSWLVLMVMLPPASVVVAPMLTVAVIWAFSPMVSLGVVISISPAFPLLLVSTDSWVSACKLRVSVALTVMLPPSPVLSVKASIWVLGWMLIWLPSRLMLPALPVLSVKAVMSMPSERVMLGLRMSIWPVFPSPLVRIVIFPFPSMLRVSGANRMMLPPSPVLSVKADIWAFSLRVSWVSVVMNILPASPLPRVLADI